MTPHSPDMWPGRPLSKVQLSDIALHFNPAWHVASMSTGQFALQLAAFPYQFGAAKDIGFGFWCLNVALFAVLTALLLIR